MTLGTLEYVLEEGSRWNWFDDATIRDCAMIAAVAGFLFVVRSLTFPRPVVDLRAFANRNFTLGQIGNTLTFRLRTPASGINGVSPALYTGPVLSLDKTSFVAAVYDGRASRLYVDGKQVAHTDLATRRPRLPNRIMPWLPGSLPIREIELCGAERPSITFRAGGA